MILTPVPPGPQSIVSYVHFSSFPTFCVGVNFVGFPSKISPKLSPERDGLKQKIFISITGRIGPGRRRSPAQRGVFRADSESEAGCLRIHFANRLPFTVKSWTQDSDPGSGKIRISSRGFREQPAGAYFFAFSRFSAIRFSDSMTSMSSSPRRRVPRAEKSPASIRASWRRIETSGP